MNNHKHSPTEAAMRRIGRIGTFVAITIAIAGCNDALSVRNPGAIQEGQLADPALVQLIVNGAIGEFQYAYGQYAQWSGVLSDETFTDHTNVDVRDFSEHNFGDLNSRQLDDVRVHPAGAPVRGRRDGPAEGPARNRGEQRFERCARAGVRRLLLRPAGRRILRVAGQPERATSI